MSFNITEVLEDRPKPFLAFLGVGLLAAAAVVDGFADWELDSSVIYLVPVSYFAWHFSPRLGIVTAVFSALTWVLLDQLKGPHYSMALIPYWNGAISLGLYLTFIYILREVKEIYTRERKGSRLDYLTGVMNRRGFYEAVTAEWKRASRHKLPTTLAYTDLDNFKQVNDRFSHKTGDELLASVGKTLRDRLRDTDLAGRLGGDEFCILLPHTDSDGARIVLGKVNEALLGVMKERNWPVTLSVGVVTFLRPTNTAEEMIKTADDAMYSAKKRGGDKIEYAVQR